jgi:hypothetical protein
MIIWVFLEAALTFPITSIISEVEEIEHYMNFPFRKM